MSEPARLDPEQLLAHAGWLRALARRLVGDPDVADDLVQETWIASLRRAPAGGDSVRPWLATVLRNALRMRARGEGRRAAREQATLVAADDVPTPDVLVARAEAQRTLVELVLGLEPALRDVVLLHFCEGIALADIARAQGVPASTVRGRLKLALERMRAALDAGDRRRARRAVGLLAMSTKGVIVAHKTTKLTALAVFLLLLLIGGFVWLRRGGGGADAHDDGAADRAGGAAGPGGPRLAGLGDDRDPDAAEALRAAGWLGQRGVAPRRIAGRVTFRGAPVAAASVELANLATESGLVSAPRLTTDASGAFDFGLRPAMAWSVRAAAPGKTAAAVAIDTRDPTAHPASDQLVVELGACDAAMVGVVRDASGGPIAGARIARLPEGRAPAVAGGPGVISDDAGHYELCVETRWPGFVSVEVSAAGYGAIAFTTMVPGRVTIDFALVPEATIVGRVVRDDTGAPVAGAHVYVPAGSRRRRQRETTARRGTFTDAAGRFRIDGVAPGRHVVRARAEGLLDAAAGVPVTVAAGDTTPELELRLTPGARIRGVVRDRNGPIAGARVRALATEDHRGVREAFSQPDGSFVLDEVPRGTVRFSALPYDVIRPERFEVTAAEHDVVLEVEPLAAITGRVVRDGDPVAGAEVDLRGPNARELGRIRSDADGHFEAKGLRPGSWVVFASSERDGAFGRAPAQVELGRGETREVTVDLAYAASVAGRVIDQQGAPVAGASVELHHASSDDAGVAVTADDGSFRARMMTGGGPYRVVVRPRPLAPVTLPAVNGGALPAITIADGHADITGVVLQVRVERLAIAGRVVDAAGAPVADARVIASPVDAGLRESFFGGRADDAATTDVAGRFRVDDLAPGSYQLAARTASGGEATLPAVAAGTGDVTIVLAAPGAIEGTLVGFTGAPQVTVVRTGGAPGARAAATVTGATFAIRALAPGRYAVLAQTDSAAASAEVEVTSGHTARVTLKSTGGATVVGHVREFRSGKPVVGMRCYAVPYAGGILGGAGAGDDARTDAAGDLTIDPAPAGEIAVACPGIPNSYSNGVRLVTLAPRQRLEIEVSVVAWRDEITHVLAGLGAELAGDGLVPRLTSVRPGGPAATAGLRDGDRVTAVDGTNVGELSAEGVWMLIANRPPGSHVRVAVSRGGATIEGDVVLGPAEP